MNETTQVTLLGFLILFLFLLMLGFFWATYILSRRPNSLSLYSRLPMRRATEISYDSIVSVMRYLYYQFQYDNRIFEIKRAAFCRQTGRIFQEAITWYDTIYVDWTFLQKRYPGNYVSWGSLTAEQQEIIRMSHDSLEEFQTEFSSINSQPNMIEAQYALTKPGPLYVDMDTKVLLGWKIVPGTELEVLIVQKPLKLIITTVT